MPEQLLWPFSASAQWKSSLQQGSKGDILASDGSQTPHWHHRDAASAGARGYFSFTYEQRQM